MKPLHLAFLGLLTPLLLGCSSSSSTYPLNLPASDYIRTVSTDDIDDFTICVMNDLHISVLTNLNDEIPYYEKCLLSNGGKTPDLVIFNGDVFMNAAMNQVSRFFSWIDSKGIPFAFVYGNHDLQGTYSNRYIDRVIKGCQNSILINPLNDNVFGDSNYVLNIEEAGALKWQLYFFDSNTYYGVDYDVIHEDQIAWYEKQQAYLTSDIPSLTFMHVPTEEFAEAYDEIGHMVTSGYINNPLAPGDQSLWYMGESISWGYRETNFYEKMQEYGHNKGIIVAHDHVNLTDWHCDKDGGSLDNMIRLIYGLKTGRGIYHDERIMGASFYTLNDSGNFDIKWMNVPYEGDVSLITNEYLVNLGEGALL
ncbi:MAG TPA: metallophosphoesterase [Bacilli bacterium]|nr:metallophosphoesterase [Bacilli bacterium]